MSKITAVVAITLFDDDQDSFGHTVIAERCFVDMGPDGPRLLAKSGQVMRVDGEVLVLSHNMGALFGDRVREFLEAHK